MNDDRTGAAMDFPDLRAFFAPQSFALVGATGDATKFGGRAIKLTQEFGYRGRLYPVNPRGGTIRGLTAYPSVRDLPEAPDHVGIVVAADRVMAVLEDCAQRGAKFATVLTSGFAETGTEQGRRLQAALTEFARRSGVRIMGPNCNGFINFVERVVFASTATVSAAPRPTGYIGIASQSGGLGMVNAMWRAQEAGLGVNHVVTCGNDADLDILDFAHFMVEDAATRVIMLIIERVPNGPKLFALARKAARAAKPLFVVKLGRTEEGRRAAASHTGAMSGSDAVHDAAFRQAGIIRCVDCNEMYEAGMLLGSGRLPGGRGASSLSISGGNVVMLTDLGAVHGIAWPRYGDKTQEDLARLMPSYGSVSNPTDLTTAAMASPDMFQRVLDTIAADASVDVMIPIVTFGTKADIDYTIAAAERSSKPYALLWSGACIDVPELRPRDIVRRGVPVYRDVLECVRAVGRAMDYGDFLRRARATPRPRRPHGIDPDGARSLLARAGEGLTEQQSKAVLAAYGIRVTQERLATGAEEAGAIAAAFGSPVALKISSADIAHKTEAGGVRLNVTAQAAQSVFADIVRSAKDYRAGARIEGVLVQEMARPGLELMLGVSRDAVFGPVVAVALGGIQVEALADVVYRVAPVTRDEAARMLQELRGRRLLESVRGAPPRDVDALCDAIERLSWLAIDLVDRVLEVDINPLLVYERGAGVLAVDGLVVPADGGGGA
ncbi:MAG: acetate--CoA ligase family protein [Burkholderiales bacterium]|nr:acetate--CoA ligase family protein [Burkholderiales bacterium]